MHHPVVDKIKDLLNSNSIWFEIFKHEPVTTSEEASNIRTGYVLGQGTKALIIRVKNEQKGKHFIMVIVPGDMKFSTKKLELLGYKYLRFATLEEVSSLTGGVERGGVPPFGNILFNLPMIIDKKVFENEKIIFNAGDRSISVGMFSSDYKNITKAPIESISE